MNGRAVFKHACTHVPEVIQEVLEKTGYQLADVDLLVPHQANMRITEAVVKITGMNPEKVDNSIQKYGNCASASVPISWSSGTAAASERLAASPCSTSVVKVVLDVNSDALYFSRAPLPDRAHARGDADDSLGLRHVGVYAWRPAALARFRALEPTPGERAENLEQLRWLENGGRMRVLIIDRAPHGIDTPEDYRAALAKFSAS